MGLLRCTWRWRLTNQQKITEKFSFNINNVS